MESKSLTDYYQTIQSKQLGKLSVDANQQQIIHGISILRYVIS